MNVPIEEFVAAELMTRNFVAVAPEDALGFHHLPITEEGRPLGVVGLRAVVGALRPPLPVW